MYESLLDVPDLSANRTVFERPLEANVRPWKTTLLFVGLGLSLFFGLVFCSFVLRTHDECDSWLDQQMQAKYRNSVIAMTVFTLAFFVALLLYVAWDVGKYMHIRWKTYQLLRRPHVHEVSWW